METFGVAEDNMGSFHVAIVGETQNGLPLLRAWLRQL